jgi:Leucine-rich repeat (LRR) protein
MFDVFQFFSRVSSARPLRVFVALVACLFTASMVHAQAPTEVPPRVRALALKGAQFTFNEEGKATGVVMPPFANGAMISSLMDVPTLESLSLRDIQLTKEDLLSIAHHPQLHSVDLSLTEIGAEEIDALQEWKDLRALNLSRNDSVDDALVWNHVCNLDDLEWLDLSETRVTSLSYSKIGALTKLRYLSLANRRSRRRNLPSYYTLGPLPALEILDLHGDFTSSQLPMLVHLKSLRELRVPYGEISISKLFALKKHMPKLHIAPHAIYPGSFTLD